jgi:hypothetical protein
MCAEIGRSILSLLGGRGDSAAAWDREEKPAMTTKAPTLAWLLVALTCFLVGMAITEGRRQVAAYPVLPPAGVVVTVEVIAPPTPTPATTPTPEPAPAEAISIPRFTCTDNAR